MHQSLLAIFMITVGFVALGAESLPMVGIRQQVRTAGVFTRLAPGEGPLG